MKERVCNMKECDEKFKTALSLLYAKIHKHYCFFKEISDSVGLEIPGIGENICIRRFVEKVDSKYKSSEDLSSFVSYINCIYPSLREDDCIHQPKPEDKPEDTYKPGDRVFFVRHRVEEERTNIDNYFMGVLSDFDADYKSGHRKCELLKSFAIMRMETLSIYNSNCDDALISKIIDENDFPKSLYYKEPGKSSMSGLLTFFPVDEKHFPKLNSIVAKIAKPKPDESPRIDTFMSFGWAFP